jgi:hypothetical protein
MSTNTTSCSDARQQAIDLRLDAIDRALMGLLPRHERQELVAQLETKIRDTAAAGPVDAELGESSRERAHQFADTMEPAEFSSAVQPSRSLSRRRFLPGRTPRSRLAVASGVLGMVALALLVVLPIVYVMAEMTGDEMLALSLLGGHVSAATLGGLLAVALGIAALVKLNRREGRLVGHGWAITGLCTGPLPMFVGGLVALVIGAELLGSFSVTSVYTASTVSPPGPTVVASPYGAPTQAVPASGYATPASFQPSAPPTGSPYAGAGQPSYAPPTFNPYAGQSPAYAPGAGACPAPIMETAAPQPNTVPQPDSEVGGAPLSTAEAAPAPAATPPTAAESPSPPSEEANAPADLSLTR